ncbi:MAG: hypothetical protein FWH01_09495 [Oscillospiraceae bacterium]|nr:hypothetical protein [Oscillospiraceae bacterium]
MKYDSMEDMIKNAIEDDSDRELGYIRFLVRCGACDEIWHSALRRFTMAGVAAENENRRVILDAKWEREWKNTRRQAVVDAVNYFNFCPICKKISCGICFRICDTIDMCASCSERLGEHCEPSA